MTVTGKIRKVQMREETTEKLGLDPKDGEAGRADERRDRHPGRRVLAALPRDEPDAAPTCSATTAAPREFEEATRESEDRDIAALRDFAQRAAAIDESGLDEQQRITRAVLAADATSRADLTEARLTELAADPIFGPQVSMPILMGMLALPDADVAEALVDKFRGIGPLLPRAGRAAARGRRPRACCPPRSRSADTVAQIDELLVDPGRRRPAARTRRSPPDGLDVDGWKARLRAAIESDVRPGMEAYRDVLRDEVLPLGRPRRAVRPELAARRRCGVRRNPALLHDHHEDRPGDPRHRAGADRQARRRVPRPRSRGRRHRRPPADLRGDAHRPEAALQHGRGAGRGLRGRDAAGVGRDARVVRGAAAGPVRGAGDDDRRQGVLLPARPATAAAAARSSSTSPTRRPGAPSSSRRWPSTRASPATTSSSRSPASSSGVPEFRKHIHNAAYAEGWGLYTERLSDEMGLYSSAVDRMGMFAADSMRACRLVVDTGLHALGWSRQQAVDYMVANSPLAEGVVPAGGRPLHRLAGPGDAPTWSGDSRSSGCAPRPSSARAAPST